MNFSLFCLDTVSEFTFTSVGNCIRGAVSNVNEGFEGVDDGAAEAEGIAEGTAAATDAWAFGAKVSSIDLR
jgi:hypothetical protein